VIQTIRDLGLAENTLLIWTTDNGAWVDAWPDAGYTPFRGMKGSAYEGGFRVPAIAWWPGKIRPGTVATEDVAYGLVADICGTGRSHPAAAHLAG